MNQILLKRMSIFPTCFAISLCYLEDVKYKTMYIFIIGMKIAWMELLIKRVKFIVIFHRFPQQTQIYVSGKSY